MNARYELQERQARNAVNNPWREGLQYEARKLEEMRSAAAAEGMELLDWMRARLDAANGDYLQAWLNTGVGLSIMWYHAAYGRWQYIGGRNG